MTKPEDLITINNGHKADQTLRELEQYLRVDLVKGDPVKCQILFDRRHPKNMRQSKPVGYLTYSRPNVIGSFACDLFSAETAILLHNKQNYDLKNVIRNQLESWIIDIEQTTKQYLEALKK